MRRAFDIALKAHYSSVQTRYGGQMYFLVALAFVITYFLTWQIAFLAYASIKKTKPSENSYSLIGIGCLAVEFVVVSILINSF